MDLICKDTTKAIKRYQRRVLIVTGVYLVMVLGGAELVKHVQLGQAMLYTVAVVIACPMVALLAVIGLYLQEETDEFLRLQMMRSLLVGTAALMALLVVSDFVRMMANGPELRPLVGFVLFFVAFGIAQAVQKLANRRGSDDEPVA